MTAKPTGRPHSRVASHQLSRAAKTPRGRFFPKRLYKLRARVEQAIGKLKRFKRVAMRCEKTDISYSAIISFACGLMLVKSVHRA
jgi:transposase